MAVYYSKSRKSWFIRYSWKGKLFYCYSTSERPFLTRKAALSFEPVFVASLSGKSSAFAKPILCDDLYGVYFGSLFETLKGSTVYGFRKFFLRYIAPVFSGVDVYKLDNNFLDVFNLKLNRCGNKSMGRAVSVSRHWVKFLKRYNAILDYERVFAFKKDVPAPHVYHFYTIGQFRVFMSAIASPRDRLLFGVLFYYGLRISEALALKGSDFKGGWLSVSRGLNAKNSEGHQIITTPKTSSSIRRLPPVPQVQALLKEYPHGDGFLFPSAFYRHRLLGQTEVDRLRKRYAEAAGLPAIKNHEFRDSCSVALISHGVSTRYVSRWLGHASEATTQKYYADLLPDEKTVISDFWATDPKDLSFNKQK